jgi:peptide/nickel transport system permease protein
MLQYIARRLLLFVPTLIAISFMAFGLRQLAPGDPVDALNQSSAGEKSVDIAALDRAYFEKARLLHLDKPQFYFVINAAAYPDTFFHILQRTRRQTLDAILQQTGNWPAVSAYYIGLRNLDQTLRLLPDSLRGEPSVQTQRGIQDLQVSALLPLIEKRLEHVQHAMSADPRLFASLEHLWKELKKSFADLKNQPKRYLLYIPSFKWFGLDNQYHAWVMGCLHGDLGISYIDGQPVSDKIRAALTWTLLINVFALVFAYVFAIPLGVYAARKKDQWQDRVLGFFLFALFALPAFWVAIMLLVLFTTPEFGMQFFTVTGISDLADDATLGERLAANVRHLILPVICLTYGFMAYIARQMRGAMLQVLDQDYIRTARAKGLPERKVIWQHAFQNALFPMITLFGAIFPAMLAGSILVESIFNVPGMGKMAVGAISQHDWPMVYAILMIGALLTMLGILLADILYAIVDPRIRLKH